MQKIKYLEGLRGIAALITLFAHLAVTCFITHQQFLYSKINNWEVNSVLKLFLINSINKLVDGKFAVWIFWVLSAYVISILFFKKNENYDKVLIGYFTKRYFRLFIPVLFSVIFAYLLLKFGFMYNRKLAVILGPPYQNGWLDNFYFFEPDFFKAVGSAMYATFFSYRPDYTYNSVLWTIQNEFLGSLFTFSIFGVIRHNSKRYILYFIIMVVLIKLEIIWLCAFVLGHILCDYDFSNSENRVVKYIKAKELRIHSFKFIGFVFSILFMVFGNEILDFLQISPDYNNLILSVFLVYICLRNDYYKSIFSSKIPYWLGKISFGLYLIQLPIICSLTSYLILANNTFQGKIVASVITIALVLMGAAFFTKFIDKKSVYFANRVGDYFKQFS